MTFSVPSMRITGYGSLFLHRDGRSWRVSPGGRVYLVRGREWRVPRWIALRAGLTATELSVKVPGDG